MRNIEKTTPSISDVEVKVEVFRVMRASSDLRPKEVYNKVNHLVGTGASNKQLLKALTELAEMRLSINHN